MQFFKNLYLNNLFFYMLIGIVAGFVLAYLFPGLYFVCWLLLFSLLAFTAIDILLLFATKQDVKASRTTPEKLSNGDENPIAIKIKNNYSFSVFTKIIDEIPFQFQMRNFEIDRKMEANGKDELEYNLRPTERGEYLFGNLNVYISSPLRIVSRRFRFANDQMVPTYPSYI